MTPLIQNLSVIMILLLCLAYVGWQMLQAFRGRKSKLGSCCAKGCGAIEPAASAQPKPAPVQFMPIENLGRRPRKSST